MQRSLTSQLGLVLALSGATVLTGCMVGSAPATSATSDDPLEYVDDLPADSAARRCTLLNARLDHIEELFPDAALGSFEGQFDSTVNLQIDSTIDDDEAFSTVAEASLVSFASEHDMTSFERLHTLNSRSCIAGSIIGEFSDGTDLYRVTLSVRGQSNPVIEFLQIETATAW
ncbi:MAG: DUF4783 domain-containing protein [Sandaracinaceae bacterium]|jgi:hypothetical protein|nr:DUF4783 domain-containing protein [Sandaracinaceae bacterium]